MKWNLPMYSFKQHKKLCKHLSFQGNLLEFWNTKIKGLLKEIRCHSNKGQIMQRQQQLPEIMYSGTDSSITVQGNTKLSHPPQGSKSTAFGTDPCLQAGRRYTAQKQLLQDNHPLVFPLTLFVLSPDFPRPTSLKCWTCFFAVQVAGQRTKQGSKGCFMFLPPAHRNPKLHK